MILSDNYKFVIMHIPKTGGSTITNYFKKYNTCNSYTILWGKKKEIDHAHLSVSEIKNWSDNKRDLTKFKWFAFVRNPYDRIYSAYTYLKRNPEFPFNSYQDFLLYIKYNPYQYIHARPLDTFLNYEQMFKYGIKIYRLERFQQHFTHLLSIFHLPKAWTNYNVASPNLTEVFRYEHIYLESPCCIGLIDEIYATDFTLFKYPKYNLDLKKFNDYPRI